MPQNPKVIAVIDTGEALIPFAITAVKDFLALVKSNTDAADTAQLARLDQGYAAAEAHEQAILDAAKKP